MLLQTAIIFYIVSRKEETTCSCISNRSKTQETPIKNALTIQQKGQSKITIEDQACEQQRQT